MKKYILLSAIISAVFTSCHNDDWEFPDYEYATVYFAYQYPVRTITMGEDIYDTSLDNEHKCKIMATTGGTYTNKTDISIDITVDNALCTGLLFGENGDEIKVMPSGYYSLASDKIVIPSGDLIGGIEVQLTDAFFADPLSVKNTYVIPLRVTNVQNADSVLRGKPLVDNPNRCITSDWDVVPKDYVLYAVKYINTWHATYLRRGKDIVKGKNGNTSLDKTVVRHAQYVERDELCSLVTRSMSENILSLTVKDNENRDIPYDLILRFDNSGKCTISSESENYTISGSGQFVEKGDKGSWGNEDRNVLYLSYEADFANMHYTVTDTLAVRDRGVGMETFIPVLK
ncbi:MAG: DUF5627 domain-containing protein [Dysgonamonadaceae bacterium]|nr:DUF5627 domain-containing protein [Dysgonamonadaceae bacterium]